jgi:hypothetical protein
MCSIGIVDYSASGECGGGRGSGVKGRGGEEGNVENRGDNGREGQKKIIGEKGKWGKRGLSRVIFGPRGRGYMQQWIVAQKEERK